MNPLPLTYSQATPIPTPKPVAESAAVFDKLNEATIRNRDAVNQHLERLAVDVGPNVEDQSYVDVYKNKFTGTVKDYAERGDYAYLGREVQNNIEGFLRDKNIRNMRQSWLQYSSDIDGIRNNPKIQMDHKAEMVKRKLAAYKFNGDLEAQVYQTPTVESPFEQVDVQTTLMKNLTAMHTSSLTKGTSQFADGKGMLTPIPGVGVIYDSKGNEIAYNPYTGVDKARYPFIFNSVDGTEALNVDAVREMATAVLDNDKEAMGYLVQDYVVKHKDEYGGDLSDVVNGILSGEFQGSDKIKNEIIDATVNKVSDSYAYTNKVSKITADYVPGWMSGEGRGRSGSDKQEVEPNIYVTGISAASNSEPVSNTKELYVARTENKKALESDITRITSGAIDQSTNTVKILDADGSTKSVELKEYDKLNTIIKKAVLDGDDAQVRAIATKLKLDPKIAEDLISNGLKYRNNNAVYDQLNQETKSQLINQVSSDQEKNMIRFTPEMQELVNKTGLDYNTEFQQMGGGTDAANLQLLTKALYAIDFNKVASEMDSSTSTKSYWNVLNKAAKFAFGNVAGGIPFIGDKLGELTTKALKELNNAIMSTVYGGMKAMGGMTEDQLMGASSAVAKIMLSKQDPKEAIAKLQAIEDGWDGKTIGINPINRLEGKFNDILKNRTTSSSTMNIYSPGYNKYIDVKKDKENIINVLYAKLNQWNGKDKNITNVELYTVGGDKVDFNNLKDVGLSDDALQGMLNENNVNIISIAPGPSMQTNTPMLEFTIKNNKEGTAGSTSKPFFIPIDLVGGITSANLETLKASPEFRLSEAERLASIKGLSRMPVDGTSYKVINNGTSDPQYEDANGNILDAQKGRKAALNEISKTQMQSVIQGLPDISKMQFKNGLIDVDDPTTVALYNKLVSKGILKLSNYTNAAQVSDAIRTLINEYNKVKTE